MPSEAPGRDKLAAAQQLPRRAAATASPPSWRPYSMPAQKASPAPTAPAMYPLGRLSDPMVEEDAPDR